MQRKLLLQLHVLDSSLSSRQLLLASLLISWHQRQLLQAASVSGMPGLTCCS